MAIRSFAGQGGANTMAQLAQRNLLDPTAQVGLINKGLQGIGQINPQRDLRNLMAQTNEGNYAQNIGLINSLAAQSSPEYQQQAKAQQAQFDALTGRGIQQGTLDLGIQGQEFTEEQAPILAQAKVKAAKDLFGRQVGLQDDRQNFQMHKQDELMQAQEKQAKIKAMYDLNLAKYKSGSGKAGKPSIVESLIRKDTGSKAIEEITKPRKEIQKEFERYQEDDNTWWDVKLGDDTAKKLSNMSKSYIANPNILDESKTAFMAMNPMQKAKFLATQESTPTEFVETGLLDTLLPTWAGGSDYRFRQTK